MSPEHSSLNVAKKKSCAPSPESYVSLDEAASKVDVPVPLPLHVSIMGAPLDTLMISQCTLLKGTLSNTADLELHNTITHQQQQPRQRAVPAQVFQHCAPQVSAAALGGSRPREVPPSLIPACPSALHGVPPETFKERPSRVFCLSPCPRREFRWTKGRKNRLCLSPNPMLFLRSKHERSCVPSP